jgi:hypothetical protein
MRACRLKSKESALCVKAWGVRIESAGRKVQQPVTAHDEPTPARALPFDPRRGVIACDKMEIAFSASSVSPTVARFGRKSTSSSSLFRILAGSRYR